LTEQYPDAVSRCDPLSLFGASVYGEGSRRLSLVVHFPNGRILFRFLEAGCNSLFTATPLDFVLDFVGQTDSIFGMDGLREVLQRYSDPCKRQCIEHAVGERWKGSGTWVAPVTENELIDAAMTPENRGCDDYLSFRISATDLSPDQQVEQLIRLVGGPHETSEPYPDTENHYWEFGLWDGCAIKLVSELNPFSKEIGYSVSVYGIGNPRSGFTLAHPESFPYFLTLLEQELKHNGAREKECIVAAMQPDRQGKRDCYLKFVLSDIERHDLVFTADMQAAQLGLRLGWAASVSDQADPSLTVKQWDKPGAWKGCKVVLHSRCDPVTKATSHTVMVHGIGEPSGGPVFRSAGSFPYFLSHFERALR
jgi:hypothetical protein